MTDLSPALRGLRWQYATDRIDLAELERKLEAVLALEAREPSSDELVAVSKLR